MELYQLRAFVTTAESGQITRAAERLHLTQPAVSAQIKALEQEIGVPLFERVGCGVRLTRAGCELLKHAKSVLTAAAGVVVQGRRLREGGCQEFRLGTVLHPQYIRLGTVVRALFEKFPLLQLKLKDGQFNNVIDNVLNGELDAAFFVGDQRQVSISYMTLATLEYCVVGGVDWWEKMEHASLEQLCELPWLAASRASTQCVLLEKLFEGSAVKPSLIVEAEPERTRICLIIEGLGLALMRRELAVRYQKEGRVVIWPGTGPSTQLSFAYLTERRDDCVLEVARDLVWNICREQVDASDVDSSVSSKKSVLRVVSKGAKKAVS